mmetsp:Transcript_81372/g.178903  ORF Transcript_81372/g.178903 Transcript_81372/m.178903 type:complete len:347 (+) Transcript_81372:290-1330(+)
MLFHTCKHLGVHSRVNATRHVGVGAGLHVILGDVEVDLLAVQLLLLRGRRPCSRLSGLALPRHDDRIFVLKEANHGLTEVLAHLGDHGGVAPVSAGGNHGPSALGRVGALEDARANEDAIDAEGHEHANVGRGGQTTGCEGDDRQAAGRANLFDELDADALLLRVDEDLIVAHGLEAVDLREDSARVSDSVHDVAGACVSLKADHSSTLRDASKGLTKVLSTADEGDGEAALVDVVGLVGGSQNLGLVDAVNCQGLQDAALVEVADARLGHDRQGDGLHDLLDHLGVRGPGDTAVRLDVGGDALQGHDGDGASRFGDAGLLGVDDVHDHAALLEDGEGTLHGDIRG